VLVLVERRREETKRNIKNDNLNSFKHVFIQTNYLKTYPKSDFTFNFEENDYLYIVKNKSNFV